MIINERDLSEKIHQLSLLQQEYVHEQLKMLKLNVHQARSLGFILLSPGAIQKELANYLGKQDATVTNILKSLESKKLIYREIPNNNERQKKIYLTAGGEKLAKQVHKIFLTLNDKLEETLTSEEKQTLSSLLARLTSVFD